MLLLYYIFGEGNGNPLQYSCLENPRDRGAWWAIIYGVAQSHTRLKRLSSSSSILYIIHSIKEINLEYSLGELMLEWKLQYFRHLMQRADSLEKTLMLGKTEGKRRQGWKIRWLDGIIDTMDLSLSKLQEIVKDREAWCAVVHAITESRTPLSD